MHASAGQASLDNLARAINVAVAERQRRETLEWGSVPSGLRRQSCPTRGRPGNLYLPTRAARVSLTVASMAGVGSPCSARSRRASASPWARIVVGGVSQVPCGPGPASALSMSRTLMLSAVEDIEAASEYLSWSSAADPCSRSTNGNCRGADETRDGSQTRRSAVPRSTQRDGDLQSSAPVHADAFGVDPACRLRWVDKDTVDEQPNRSAPLVKRQAVPVFREVD